MSTMPFQVYRIRVLKKLSVITEDPIDFLIREYSDNLDWEKKQTKRFYLEQFRYLYRSHNYTHDLTIHLNTAGDVEEREDLMCEAVESRLHLRALGFWEGAGRNLHYHCACWVPNRAINKHGLEKVTKTLTSELKQRLPKAKVGAFREMKSELDALAWGSYMMKHPLFDQRPLQIGEIPDVTAQSVQRKTKPVPII